VNPYGMRYHVVVKSAEEFKKLVGRWSNDFESHPIQPSLEDVFIQLVEGKAK
jgi:hypothetical protein